MSDPGGSARGWRDAFSGSLSGRRGVDQAAGIA